MSKTIVGLYDDHGTAEKVVDALDNQNFDRSDVHVDGPDSIQGTGTFGDDAVRGLTGRGVPDEEARFYAEGVRRGGTLVMIEVADDRAQAVADVMNEHRPVQMGRRQEAWSEEDDYEGYDPDADRYTEEEVRAERERHADEEESVPVVEEEVRIGKRSVQRGGIRIHTRVVEEAVEEDVTVRDEEIEVDERRVDRELSADEADAAFQDQDVEMTETDEEVVVEKTAHQTGEVRARKTAEDRTEHVSETARRTEVDVEQIGKGEHRHAEATDFGDYDEDFRTHYNANYDDDDYAAYEPAYRYGHRFASDERYADRSYSEVEPEMKRGYEQEHGKGTWEKVKDAARHAFTSSSSRRQRA